MSEPLLIEIGCEEIPARMIGAAAEDLRLRVASVLDQAGIEHGSSKAWGGARRLAVHVESVAAKLPGKDELVLGPPAAAAFRDDGTPTPAGAGFAKKQGIDPAALQKIETEKGLYAGFRRAVGRTHTGRAARGGSSRVDLRDDLPEDDAVGTHRFVRPVHSVVALHGADVVELSVLGAGSGRSSDGHRFLAPGPVVILHADRYVETLRAARVLVDPVDRRAALTSALDAAARAVGGTVVQDDALLDEVVDLVEWPGVVAGRFDASFLDLPQEILVTTLKHHQKSFSVRGKDGLLPAFLSVANTDRDPAGHVRRGNEWVVVGRLDDARFFWDEDRKRPLASRVDDLKRVTFHKKLGSYEEKTRRMTALAETIAGRLGASVVDPGRVAEAAQVAKADLVTGLVGEFPELQGIVGGLILRAEGAPADIAAAVAEHYKPVGADDSIPATPAGCVVSIADRLDTITGLIRAGETPTGSRDPFGLRRATGGVFRILAERAWPISMNDLFGWAERNTGVQAFLQDRLNNWLADRGFTTHEIEAVRRSRVSPTDFDQWPISNILARLDVVATLRGRTDFARLVELTKRVDNILDKQPEAPARSDGSAYAEKEDTALALLEAHDALQPLVKAASSANDFSTVIDHVSGLVGPVAKFFDDVLVLDPANPAATRWRCELLAKVRTTVTRDFDIRELAGQADSNR